MTNKQLKTLLRKKAEKVTVKDVRANVLQNVNHTPVYENEPATVKRSWFYPVIAVAVAICLTVAIIPSLLTKTPEKIEITSTEQVLADEIVTAGSLLADTTVLTSNVDDDGKSDAENDIFRFLKLGSSFIKPNGIVTEGFINKDKGFENYEYKLIVTDNESNLTYTVYYNTATESAEEKEIVGVFIINDIKLNFEAEKETEDDEVELELKLFTSKNSYIKISNSKESEDDGFETEYSYQIVANDKPLIEVTMEYETSETTCSGKATVKTNKDFIGFEYSTTNVYEFSASNEGIFCSINLNGIDLFTLNLPIEFTRDLIKLENLLNN